LLRVQIVIECIHSFLEILTDKATLSKLSFAPHEEAWRGNLVCFRSEDNDMGGIPEMRGIFLKVDADS